MADTPVSTLPAVLQNELTLAAFRASEILRTSHVPDEAIYTHPGKGGKQFEYIKHTWATKLVQDALDFRWSFDVLDARVEADGSAWARVRFVVYIPYTQPDGRIEWFENSITEIGAFEGNEKMNTANKLASATSRGLLRCLMRRYGIGLELYGAEEEELTFKQAWSNIVNTVCSYVAKHGNEADQEPVMETVRNAIKAAGITEANMVDRFSEAYQIAYTVVRAFYVGDTPSFADGQGEGSGENTTPATKEESPAPPEPAPQPTTKPDPPETHWSQDISTVERLLEQVRPIGMGSEQVRQALKVPRISDFRGTKEDAMALIRQYAIDNQEELQKRQDQRAKVRVTSSEPVDSPFTEGRDQDWL